MNRNNVSIFLILALLFIVGCGIKQTTKAGLYISKTTHDVVKTQVVERMETLASREPTPEAVAEMRKLREMARVLDTYSAAHNMMVEAARSISVLTAELGIKTGGGDR
ncbi:MAG: hypothetical protein IH874_04010 [Candidatus Dadabacteria bacterium]|nr:hypothetical protein [Candidatus Dadabacteria bacterium]